MAAFYSTCFCSLYINSSTLSLALHPYSLSSTSHLFDTSPTHSIPRPVPFPSSSSASPFPISNPPFLPFNPPISTPNPPITVFDFITESLGIPSIDSTAMASLISNPVGNTNSDRIKRKKKKKSPIIKDNNKRNHTEAWKSKAQQQIYSSKLVQDLSQVSLKNPSPFTPHGNRAVRDAAYRVLAVAVKGRTRWSRAILMNRIKLKFRKQKRPKGLSTSSAVGSAVVTGNSWCLQN